MLTFDDNDWITTAQAALVLGISQRQVRRLCHDGALPAVSFCGRIRIPPWAVPLFRDDPAALLRASFLISRRLAAVAKLFAPPRWLSAARPPLPEAPSHGEPTASD